jgi:hypothetical protein
MKTPCYILLIISVLSTGCSTPSKVVQPTPKSQHLDEWVAQKSFEISSDWAIPLMTTSFNQVANAGLMPPGSSANRISLIGNPNHFRFNFGEVDAFLPFYGERQVGGGYNSTNSGIVLQGIPKNYQATRDERSLRHTIKFDMTNKTEAFDVTLTLYPDLNAEIQINSSQRFPMRYTGKVKAIVNE